MVNFVCRICSSREEIVDVFHSEIQGGDKLRLCLAFASGIEIQENDPISRMACHRCCEMATKFYKFRSNSISNDKFLKEQHCQPYSLPITDYVELNRVASKIQSDDGLLQLETDDDPFELLNKYIQSNTKEHSICAIRTHNEDRAIDNHSTTTILADFTAIDEKYVTTDNNFSHKHKSVELLLQENNNLILPTEIYGSDISPVISLDGGEVNDWFAKQIELVKERLANVKKIHNASSSSYREQRLRKRTYVPIFESTDSEDDDNLLFMPFQKSCTVPAASVGSGSNKTKAHKKRSVTSRIKKNSSLNSMLQNTTKEESLELPPEVNVLNSNHKSDIAFAKQSRSIKLNLHCGLNAGINIENTHSSIETCTLTNQPISTVKSVQTETVKIDKRQSNENLGEDEFVMDIEFFTDNEESEAVNLLSNEREAEVLQNLFKKQSTHIDKIDKSSETFNYSNSKIHHLKNKVNVKNLMPELQMHNVPIEINGSSVFNVKFSNNVKRRTRVQKCWTVSDVTNIYQLRQNTPRQNVIKNHCQSSNHGTNTTGAYNRSFHITGRKALLHSGGSIIQTNRPASNTSGTMTSFQTPLEVQVGLKARHMNGLIQDQIVPCSPNNLNDFYFESVSLNETTNSNEQNSALPSLEEQKKNV